MDRRRLLGCLVALVLVLSACGDDGGGEGERPEAEGGTFTVEHVADAFEEAGGVPFIEQTSLVEGTVALGPGPLELESEELTGLNDALGESSVLFEVYVFEGEDPPLFREAARATAFSSATFEDLGGGVYLGDFDTAYYANGNAVLRGPLLNGNPDDETLQAWREVVDSL